MSKAAIQTREEGIEIVQEAGVQLICWSILRLFSLIVWCLRALKRWRLTGVAASSQDMREITVRMLQTRPLRMTSQISRAPSGHYTAPCTWVLTCGCWRCFRVPCVVGLCGRVSGDININMSPYSQSRSLFPNDLWAHSWQQQLCVCCLSSVLLIFHQISVSSSSHTHRRQCLLFFLLASAVTAAIQSSFAETSSVCEVYSKWHFCWETEAFCLRCCVTVGQVPLKNVPFICLRMEN